MSRIVHHGGTHRIELDVALTTKQIGLGLDQGRFVAAAPQSTGAAVGSVDVLQVTSPQGMTATVMATVMNYVKGTSKNSYFVAPAKAGVQSNQQAGFPPSRE